MISAHGTIHKTLLEEMAQYFFVGDQLLPVSLPLFLPSEIRLCSGASCFHVDGSNVAIS